jgi:glycosyltransferase involved in cell wall biosynthesis
MFHGKKIVVVMPAYNAARTLERTYREIPLDVVDEVIVVDDASHDETVEVARSLGLPTFVHPQNRGYGANQKTCYTESLRRGADVTVMLHPDYQYTPRLIAAMVAMIVDGPYDIVLGSRIIGGHARQGGMPLYKYVSNRFLTKPSAPWGSRARCSTSTCTIAPRRCCRRSTCSSRTFRSSKQSLAAKTKPRFAPCCAITRAACPAQAWRRCSIPTAT